MRLKQRKPFKTSLKTLFLNEIFIDIISKRFSLDYSLPLFPLFYRLITMESNEQPSVAVTSEVLSNNYAQQKIEALCTEVEDLKQKNIERDQELKILRANQKNINERLRAQERYSRKDSVLIVNPPFNARTSKNVTYDTLKFFDDFLGVKLTVDSIKACHIMPNTETETKCQR